jgi:hypothetical protein
LALECALGIGSGGSMGGICCALVVAATMIHAAITTRFKRINPNLIQVTVYSDQHSLAGAEY